MDPRKPASTSLGPGPASRSHAGAAVSGTGQRCITIAEASGTFFERDHLWHMTTLAKLASRSSFVPSDAASRRRFDERDQPS